MNLNNIPLRVDFTIKETKRLADLHGIEDDLRNTIKLCQSSLELHKPKPPKDGSADEWLNNNWIANQLAFNAIVQYCRVHVHGVRMRIPDEWIEQLHEEDKETHNYFKSVRDKYISHSVNSFEDNQVFLNLSRYSNFIEVSSVTVDSGRIVGFSQLDIERLNRLAQIIFRRTQIEIEIEKLKVFHLARSIPINELLTRNKENNKIPSDNDVMKNRKT